MCVYIIYIHIYSYHFEEQKLDTWGRARFKALLKEKVSLCLCFVLYLYLSVRTSTSCNRLIRN